MAGLFELKLSTNKQYHFNLLSANGQVILTSQMYTTKDAALTGMASVQTNAPYDERYERLTSGKDEPYFTLKAANGQVIGNSQMYSSAAAMENGIRSVKNNAPDATLSDLTVQASSTV